MSTTTPLMPDDRRSLMLRLSFMQYFIAAAVRGAGDRVLDLSDRAVRKVQRDGARRTTSGGCRCRRRGACCSIATARSSSRTRTRSISRSSASRPRTSSRPSTPSSRATGADEAEMREIVNRRRRDPSYRPIVLIENASARAGDCRLEPAGSSSPASSIRKCRRAGIRPARWRRSCSATSARSPRRSSSWPTTRTSSPGRSSGRPASSRPTTGG